MLAFQLGKFGLCSLRVFGQSFCTECGKSWYRKQTAGKRLPA
jgi:hypothetical protein